MSDWGRRIPTILRSDELLDKAFKRASKATAGGANRFDNAKRMALAKVSGSGDVIQSTLLKYIRAFPDLGPREEFLSELIDVLVGLDRLKKSLGALHWCAKKCSELQRSYLSKIRKARSLDEVERARQEFYGRISSLVDRISTDLTFVSECRNHLRQLPDIDTTIPTVVIAGFPNVGKSQLIERISNAKPTIAVYPFTTKGVGVGHFQRGRFVYQVIDTPGLLDRPLEKRNQIERQAILALKYLADVIIFLLDPSETSGYPMSDQLSLLDSIERWMGDIPILGVESKSDLLRSDSDRQKISALTGDGVEELMEKVLQLIEKDQTSL